MFRTVQPSPALILDVHSICIPPLTSLHKQDTTTCSSEIEDDAKADQESNGEKQYGSREVFYFLQDPMKDRLHNP